MVRTHRAQGQSLYDSQWFGLESFQRRAEKGMKVHKYLGSRCSAVGGGFKSGLCID